MDSSIFIAILNFVGFPFSGVQSNSTGVVFWIDARKRKTDKITYRNKYRRVHTDTSEYTTTYRMNTHRLSGRSWARGLMSLVFTGYIAYRLVVIIAPNYASYI